jgi:NADH-quinone oxidoreductase subunit L
MIHAFFKALLFLSGGAVIHLLHDEHDIFRMGGLRKRMPLIFITFLAGAASLAALPLVTAGFYSKDQILWYGWAAGSSNNWLWLAGITGTLLTSLYIFRLVFVVFFGDSQAEPSHKAGILITVPVVILAVLSVTGGFIELPENIGPVHLFSSLFAKELPAVTVSDGTGTETLLQLLAAAITIGGIYLAYLLFLKKPSIADRFSGTHLNDFFLYGWGFDKLYDTLFVRPLTHLAQFARNDIIDKVNYGVSRTAGFLNYAFSRVQNGRMRWYVLILTLGIVVILTFMVSQ